MVLSLLPIASNTVAVSHSISIVIASLGIVMFEIEIIEKNNRQLETGMN